ncbi:MAG: prolipoprotein diacylglyceryl transferase [Candidatus Obscuribacterales bacterium]|nr:prolipoprotein diacylglyceryl transferase [Candidatus Obscuribacterales bacterium]
MHTLVLQSPGAVFAKLGPLTIRWYGVMFAVGFICASMIASRVAKTRGIDPEQLTNFALVCFIAGIVGARLYFVALSWPEFIGRPQDIFATWQGGLSIHGGIIGGAIAGYFYALHHKMAKRHLADLVGIILPLGQAIGRWGNFFNSEAFGTPVPEGFPLAVFIPQESRPPQFANYELFHATFLYESIWDLGIFLLIYFYLLKKLSNYPGLCFLIYVALYSIGRLMIEPLRTDSIMAGSIQIPIVASFVFLLASLLFIPVFIKMANVEKRRVTTPPSLPKSDGVAESTREQES